MAALREQILRAAGLQPCHIPTAVARLMAVRGGPCDPKDPRDVWRVFDAALATRAQD